MPKSTVGSALRSSVGSTLRSSTGKKLEYKAYRSTNYSLDVVCSFDFGFQIIKNLDGEVGDPDSVV